MKILLISDSEWLSQSIAAILAEQRPILIRTASVLEACEFVAVDQFDCVVLDLDALGSDALLFLSDCPSSVHTLALAGPTSKPQLIEAVRCGASDFAVKPINPILFRLRIGIMLLRDYHTASERVRSYGRLSFDVVNSTFEQNGKPFSLTPSENALLNLLIRRPGTLVRKETICQALSETDDLVSSAAVDVHVSRLRRKLADTGVSIETARGIGYALVVDDVIGHDA